MSVFDQLTGQDSAASILAQAARSARGDGQSMSHAWLMTGPPGSGRSIAARILAAALQCTAENPGCGQCQGCLTTMSGNHPDVEIMSTEGTTIAVDQVRQLVSRAQASPTVGAWRVIIVEDADRMVERTTNVLLKAIEEPPAQTVWMLCTPSPHDVLPTIRSRCRNLSLIIPRAEDVARLLVERDGIDEQLAHVVARASQSHIGRARGLAAAESERNWRHAALSAATSIRNVGDAVYEAGELMERVNAQADKQTTERNESELADLRESMGLGENEVIPAGMRGQFKALQDEQKRRVTRSQRDALDRVMIDVLSLYRDVLVIQLGADIDVVNADFRSRIEEIATKTAPTDTIAKMDAISLARERIGANVAPLLIVEDMLTSLRLPITR